MESCRADAGCRDGGSWQAREKRISSLALRYRSGERAALGELYGELEPTIHGVLRPHLSPPRSLPVGMERQDLYQQAYVALAEAALEWQPDRQGSFVVYFLRSFPWRIDRYLRSQTPRRRTARFRLFGVPHDTLMEQASDAVGLDGRDWDDVLACAELVRGLPRLYGEVVRLHLYHGLSFEEVGEAMGIGRSASHETFERAISLLRSALEEQVVPGPDDRVPAAPSNHRNGLDAAALRRCVEAVHRLAPSGAPLPPREKLRRAAGLTWREYREIMGRLRAAGCVVGRRRGAAGSLTCASSLETMRKLERWI